MDALPDVITIGQLCHKDNDMVKVNVPKDKRFIFPLLLDIIQHKGKYIVIAREEGNWIVLDNKDQLDFFNSLKDRTLDEAMKSFHGDYCDMQWVVTQLIARHFEEPSKLLSPKPIAQLYLTNECNLHCPHCYMSAGVANENEMTTQEILAVLDGYKANGGRDVILTGGEIGLRKDLYEIVKYGSGLNLKMHLYTNGTLWTKVLIDRIAEFTTLVQISIDGYSEEENAKVRGKGNFSRALEAVDDFVSAGVNTRVAITAYYTTDLQNKIAKYVEFAESLKRKYAQCRFDVVIATGLLPGRYGHLSETEFEKYNDIMNRVNNLCYGCSNFSELGFIKRHQKGRYLNNCSYGYLSVSSTGDVYVCPVISQLDPIANIRTESMNRVFDLLNHAHRISCTDNLMPCRECDLKSICGGDCRIRYFKELRRSDIENVKGAVYRKCDENIKNSYYDLMIRTNMDIFH